MRDKIFLIIIFILLSVSVCVGVHFILIDRNGFWRLIYPLQSKLAVWSISCNRDSPLWMKKSLRYIIKNQKNLSNQIAYIDVKNNVYTCQSGWKGMVFFSNKLNENTRFRYASLTKLVTSDAILQEVNQENIKLSTKLIVLIPEIQYADLEDIRIKDITVGNLLEHRSGFDRMLSEDVVFSLKKRSWCPYNMSVLTTLELDFDPNKRYAYDNRNYCLLGAVLERIKKQSYRMYIQQQYSLNKHNIKFVNGYYYADEVMYDFRNNDFWMESDDNKFDFKALSSSAGLSGSAKQLASLIQSMLYSKPLNILSISKKTLENCKLEQFYSCDGYGMWQYQENKNKPKMYFRNGRLPGVSALAIVTNKKEVMVWLGNGAPFSDKDSKADTLEKYFYQLLY